VRELIAILMVHVFTVADECNLLSEVIKRKAISSDGDKVMDAVVQYLDGKSGSSFHYADKLLSYYMLREDYRKIGELCERMKKKMRTWRLTQEEELHWDLRVALVDFKLRNAADYLLKDSWKQKPAISGKNPK